MLRVLFLMCWVMYQSSAESMYPGALQDATLHGIKSVMVPEVVSLQRAYNRSVDAFQVANKTCMETTLPVENQNCLDCVKRKCKARVEAACPKPSDVEVALGKTIIFFGKDMPNFFKNDFKNFFENDVANFFTKDVAKFFSNDFANFFKNDFKNFFAKDVKNFFEKDLSNFFKKDFVNFFKNDIANLFRQDIANFLTQDVANFFKHDFVNFFEKDLTNFIKKDFTNFFKNDVKNVIVNDIGGGLKDFGSSIVNLFKGRRKRSSGNYLVDILLRRNVRSAKPGCEELKRNGSACIYYLPTCNRPEDGCAFDPESDCEHYNSTKNAAIASQTTFLASVAGLVKGYKIREVTFSFANYDPPTQGFTKAQAKVVIMGKPLEFTVKKPINPFNPVITGPIIATQALLESRSAKP